MVKLLFPELQVRPTTPWSDSQPPRTQLETSEPLCSRERQTARTPTWGQLTALGKNAAVFLNLIFPEFQNLSPHLVLCYKNAGLDGNKMVH